MTFKKFGITLLTVLLIGCSNSSTSPTPLPEEPFLVIAHRGASAYAPEHTLASYQLAASMEADYIELDLHMTKDRKLVALHDEVLPFPDGPKLVSQLTFKELQAFSPGILFNKKHPVFASDTYESSRIPELKEVISYFDGTVNFYIELKSPASYPGIEKLLLENLEAAGLLTFDSKLPKIIIQSFDEKSLKKVRKIEPSIPLIKLYSFKQTAELSIGELNQLKTYASGVGVNADSLSQEFIQKMHTNELHVHPFTVNSEESLMKFIDLGVNGIFTDKPDVAKRVLQNYK
ncbi:glycerophosphodiester phosphodiesterase family protein [Sporosarcina sp. CAU 1771]